MSKFVPLRSMSKHEKIVFQREIENLLDQASRIGLKVSVDLNGQWEIQTQLKRRKRGKGLRFMSKRDMGFGSAHFGKNPPW